MWTPHKPLAKAWAAPVQSETTKAFQTAAATGLRVKWILEVKQCWGTLQLQHSQSEETFLTLQ